MQTYQITLFVISCCLAFTAKGTSFIYLPIPVVILSIVALKRLGIRFLKTALILALPPAFFLVPHTARNYLTFRNFTGPSFGLINSPLSVNAILSNIPRNIAMHLKTPSKQINTVIDRLVEKSIAPFHDTNPKASDYKYSRPFQRTEFTTDEDLTGNSVHVILLLFCCLLVCFRRDVRSEKPLLLYASMIIAIFLFFNVILKWQIVHSRLQLPLFVIASPFVAIVVSRMHKKFLLPSLTLALFSFSIPFLFWAEAKPVIEQQNIFNTPSTLQYFNQHENLGKTFLDFSAIMRNHDLHKIGWITKSDNWEYPIWAIMERPAGFRLQHILVQNSSKKYERSKAFSSFVPDAIVRTTLHPDYPDEPPIRHPITTLVPDESGNVKYKDQSYLLAYERNGWMMYIRRETQEESSLLK
jgi:hypothetical protein